MKWVNPFHAGVPFYSNAFKYSVAFLEALKSKEAVLYSEVFV